MTPNCTKCGRKVGAEDGWVQPIMCPGSGDEPVDEIALCGRCIGRGMTIEINVK